MEKNGKVVGDDALGKIAHVYQTRKEGIKKLQKYSDLGVTDIVLINSSPDKPCS